VQHAVEYSAGLTLSGLLGMAKFVGKSSRLLKNLDDLQVASKYKGIKQGGLRQSIELGSDGIIRINRKPANFDLDFVITNFGELRVGLFSSINQNRRGKPLVGHQTFVNLIASTRTTKGLKVKASIDTNTYPTKIRSQTKNLLLSSLNAKNFSVNGTTPLNQSCKVIFGEALSS